MRQRDARHYSGQSSGKKAPFISARAISTSSRSSRLSSRLINSNKKCLRSSVLSTSRTVISTIYPSQVQTDFQQIGETQFLITVNDADNINHIVVFLTGAVPFPEGMGGAGSRLDESVEYMFESTKTRTTTNEFYCSLL